MLAMSVIVDTFSHPLYKKQYIKSVAVWYFDCKHDETVSITLDQGWLLQETRDTQAR